MPNQMDGTRQQILEAIREQGPVSVDQLAKELDLSTASIRRHLDILRRDHLITYQFGRKKPGRPEFLYHLTEAGHESGFRNYPTLLTLLLNDLKSLSHEDLAQKNGPDVLSLLMDRVSQRMNNSHLNLLPNATQSRLEKLELALAEQGFSPKITQSNGQAEVRLCNCPFRAAALCEESVCVSDQRLISGIMGVEPELQSSIRDGDSQCSYVIKLDGHP